MQGAGHLQYDCCVEGGLPALLPIPCSMRAGTRAVRCQLEKGNMQRTGEGTKPLALLIPGLDGTGRLYYRQLEALERRYRIRAWSYEPGADHDLHDLVRQLGDATDREEPASIRVVGESFGGLVALGYVLQYPERVAQLVLVNTFPFYRRKFRAQLACWLAPLLQVGLCRRVKESTVEFILKREGIPPEVRTRCQAVLRQIDLASYRRRLQLLRIADMRPRLHQVTVPTVLLASGRDKLVPSVGEANFMASRIPGARVYEFPEAGHGLLLTPGIVLADYM
jgi:pimeloyl-ACP methyl ester carboxylesterase